MKKTILAVLFIAAGLFTASAQTCVQELATCSFGAGASGGNPDCSIAYDVTAGGNFSVTVGNSLCGSRGVFVTVKVGRRTVHRGLSQGGDVITFSANAGQTISVTGTQGPVDSNIICIWAGEATLTLCSTN